MISNIQRIQPIDAEWFARRFERSGHSLRTLADRSEGAVSYSTLHRVMRGDKPLNLAVTILLAEAFDVSMEEIVRRAGYRPPRR